MRRNPRTRNRKSKIAEEISYKKTRTNLILFITILAIIFVGVIIFYGSKYNFNSKALIASYNKEIEEQTRLNSGEIGNREEEPSDTTFTLTALGDVLCHNTQYWDAYDKDTDTYDFSYVFDDINKYTKTSDICVASLETSFAGKERRI